MRPWGLILLLVLGVPVNLCAAQTADSQRATPVVPGLELTPVPDALYTQLPQLPRGQGVIVDNIGAELPEQLANLNRHDIVLSYDGETVRDAEQLIRLVTAAKPGRQTDVVVLRGGKMLTLKTGKADISKGTIKPGGPPAVAVECTMLEGGKLQITLEYYSETNSKLESLTCNGSLPEIEQQVRQKQLPNRVQELVDVAIKRLRMASPR